MKRLALPSFFLLLALVAAACSASVQQTLPAPSPVEQQSAFPPLPSPTPTSQPLPTLTAVVQQPSASPSLPVDTPPPFPTDTPIPTQQPTTALPTQPIQREFDAFVQSVVNGNPNQIVGVYVEGVLALRVVQQPPGQAGWVSTNEGEATEFLLAFTIAGNIGLLAHNYLSGRYFFNLRPGDIVQLIYGDGSYTEYEISEIRSFQALSPQSTSSDFVDLATGETYSATNLFYRVYGGEHHLTFQTCIERDNNSEWGRLFPMAYPYP